MAPFQELAESAAKKLGKLKPFRPLVKQFGLCQMQPDQDLFRVLVRAIIAQLISTAAARTIQGRFEQVSDNQVTPQKVLTLPEETIRQCGLSRAKTAAILGLARHYQDVPDFNLQVVNANDADARTLLLPLRGIGPWTVDMVLMFGLGRPDILPVGDLGLRAAAKDLFELDELPDARSLTALAEPWQPYRTFATWYLWRSRGWVPQSSAD